MNSTELATQALANGAVAHDPLIVGLAWVSGIVALLIAMGVPIRNYLRDSKREDKADQVGDARASAESTLYNHLSEQIKSYRDIADKAFKERNELVERVARLEENVKILDETKLTLDKLKLRLEDKDRRLDEKDEEIRQLLVQAADERSKFLNILTQKDTEIAKRDERILSLEQRQRELEIRLAKDEVSMGVVPCPFHSSNVLIRDKGVPLNPVPEMGQAAGD